MVEIWSARVYRSRDIYVGAPAQLLNKTLTVGDWAVEVTIGSVPVSITRAVAVQHAVMPYILGKINTRADPAKPTEAELKAKADAYQIEKQWRDPKRLYTTIVIRRELASVTPSGDPASAFLWYDLTNPDVEIWRKATEAEDGDTFERVGWWLLKQLDADMFGDLLPLSQAYLQIPGKEPCPIPRFIVGGIDVAKGRTVAHLAVAIAGLQADNSVPVGDDALIRVSTFFVQQATEHDPGKKFLACYSGLEAAAGGLYKSLKEKAKNAIRFEAAPGKIISGAATAELLWPGSADTETNRSIVFRFAMMALLLSPDTANEDVATFQEINKYRNRVHGQTVRREEPPNHKAVPLFSHYYPRVTTFLRTGSLPS